MSLGLFVRHALSSAPFIAATLAAPAAAQEPPAARVAHGLIVQLKGSPVHESPQSVGVAVGASQRSRLQRVIDDAGMSALQAPRLRPVGRSALHLDFGRVLQPAEAAQLTAKLAARPDVQWVVPNTREHRLATPTDPLFAPAFVGQFWLYTVSGSNSNALVNRLRGVPGFQTAWDRTTGGPAAVVAVLDTGIVAGHPDLPAQLVLPGYDFITDPGYANDTNGRDSNPADPGDWVDAADRSRDPARFADCAIEPSSWHGTDIAGLLVAATNNTTGVAGINWNGRVLPVRVAGKCGADVVDIVDGMRWAAGLQTCRVYDGLGGCTEFAPLNPNPARIINISFGGTGGCEPYQDAIDELAAMKGAVVVAAAGNERGAITRPAKCPGAIGVGAVNRDGFKTNYSNFGSQLTVVTVGGDPRSDGRWGPLLGDDGLLTLDIAGATSPAGAGYAYLFGTSFSAPLAAGTVSLMLSANANLTAAQIIDGLRRSARPHVTSPPGKIGVCSAQNAGRCICTTATCGAGLLDAEQAVAFALAPATYVAPVRQPAVIDNAEVDAAVALGIDTAGAPILAERVPVSSDGGGGGGGALGAGWLLALAMAVIAVARAPRRVSARRAE